jgi:hypothetical protein
MPRLAYKYITLVTDETGDETKIRSIFEEKGFEVVRADYGVEPAKKERKFDFTIAVKSEEPIKDIIDAVASQDFVKKFEMRS